ncbi:MAG: hypothetical protein ACXAC7_08545 [Candidatus Hodarchaeales archaeon]
MRKLSRRQKQFKARSPRSYIRPLTLSRRFRRGLVRFFKREFGYSSLRYKVRYRHSLGFGLFAWILFMILIIFGPFFEENRKDFFISMFLFITLLFGFFYAIYDLGREIDKP